MAECAPCADCGSRPGIIETHHFDDAGGPLCHRCFFDRTAAKRKANRVAGLCLCGSPPTPGICKQTGQPWKSCAPCRNERNARARDRRENARDREIVESGRNAGWNLDSMSVHSPEHFEAVMDFFHAAARLRNRRRASYGRRSQHRIARQQARGRPSTRP